MKKGVTLIESVIYIALLSLLIGGVFMSAFGLIQSSEKEAANSVIDAERNFIQSKIDWALTGLQTVHVPTGSATSSILKISKYNFDENPLEFEFKDGFLTLSRDGGEAFPLNTENVHLDFVSFKYIPASSVRLAGIQTVISLNGKTATTTHYVR